jgi:hypothetical protein
MRAFTAWACNKLPQVIKRGSAVLTDVLLLFTAFIGLVFPRGAFVAGTYYHLL